jgi:hypothetical protein
MADPIMNPAPARTAPRATPRTAPPAAPPAAPSAALHPDPELSASDLIENNLEQLHSLLCCCHGDDGLVLQGASPEHLNNVLWLAATLARQTQALFQKVAKP